MKSVLHKLVLTLTGLLSTQAILAQESQVDLERIRAYVEISDRVSTAGQIGYDQIEAIKEAGFDAVVNLAPSHEPRNGREGFLVVEQGMTYMHIPVNWQHPSQRDLALFFDFMDANRDRKVFVHCFANMRVSVFVYLYRTLRLSETKEAAWKDVLRVWDPNEAEQWKQFIEEAQKEAGGAQGKS